ncbi:MAG: DNA-binding protein WhiA [Clostridia bacterium]|nr:DNA-binding protein WhiA [Clostridia bacterium]
MSFADEVRNELSQVAVKTSCCRRALTAGLLLGAAISPGKQISLRCRSQTAADAVCAAVALQYGKQPDVQITGRCGHTFWDVSFSSPACVKMLLQLREENADAAGVIKFSCDSCRSNFLRGVFLTYGTVNDPHKSFHLEFSMPNGWGAEVLAQVLTAMGYPPRAILRKENVGLYFKDSASVEDLITAMGAHHCLFEVINSRIERDIRNNENRATNCVAKNIEKSIAAATRQIEAIGRLIETGKLEALPEGLRTTAMLRYRNPDASLEELTALHEPPISKSGLNHRLQKILAEAGDL